MIKIILRIYEILFFLLELNTKASWAQHNYHVDFLQKYSQVQDNCPRISQKIFSVQDFVTHFEIPYKPVVILDTQVGWKANEKWTLEKLAKKYRNQKFKCGEDNEGYSVKLKMKYYVKYMMTTKDDSPLYIFDSSFGEVSLL